MEDDDSAWLPAGSTAARDFLAARTRAEEVQVSSSPTTTTHATLRRGERGIKAAYVVLCVRRGSRTQLDDNNLRYWYRGLIVVTSGEKVVLTAYWADGYYLDPDGCIQRFDAECRKARKAEHVAKHARRDKTAQPAKKGK